MTDDELRAEIAKIPYFYHRIRLSENVTTPGWAPIDPTVYRIPDDLTGKRVLDVGAWDGYWSFYALKRGAEFVQAIDDFSDTCGNPVNADRAKAWETFDLCAKALGYQIGFGKQLNRDEYDVCRLGARWDSAFDCIFCFGVLYHLRHPLLALERLRFSCCGTIHIETAILDGCQSAYDPTRGYDGSECVAEFYPNAEYGMNKSNWHVGTLRYWAALVEAAGFKNIETWKLTDNPTCVAECRGFIRATV